MRKSTESQIPRVKAALLQFAKFGVVGTSSTVISYGTYLICIHCGMHYLLANVLGFLLSVINAFFWNNRYVFKPGEKKRSLLRSFCKTFLTYAGTGLVLNNLLLYLQVDVLGWSKLLAPVLNLLVTTPLNFLLNKKWAFK